MDLGCSCGCNLAYFLHPRLGGLGLDMQPEVIAVMQELGRVLAPGDAQSRFMVLHFADDEAHFGQMLEAAWSVVEWGNAVVRLCSEIDIEGEVAPRSQAIGRDQDHAGAGLRSMAT